MGKDDNLDFKSWKIKQLQEYIRQQGGNDEDCDEKQDLVDRATELRDKKEKEKEKEIEKEKASSPTSRNYPAPSYGGAPPSAPPFNPQYGGAPPYGSGPPPYGGAPPPYGGAPPYGGPPPPQYGAEYRSDYGAPPPYGGPPPYGAPPSYGGPPPGPYGGPPPGQWGGPPPQGGYGGYGQGPPGPCGGPPQGGYGGPPPPQGGGYGGPPQQQPGYGEPPAPQGRKKALICACNYAGSDNALNGCINDAKCMQYLLKTRFGFKEEDITMLTDDQSDPAKWPTGNNMRTHIRRLVGDSQPGDSLVFHFSGHGSQTADWSGDEDDGYNETLCPCDFKHGGQIVDDELNQLLINPLRPGVRLHAIIDACHSGSVLDLEYRAEFQNGLPVWTNEFSKRPSVYKGTAGGEAFQFGAARDSQTAADTSQLSGNVSTGAATFAFIQAIERTGTHISYGRLLDEMNRTLGDMGHGGGAGSGQPLSDPFQMGGLLGALLGQGLGMAGGGQQYSNQTPVLSSNQSFDINRPLCI